MQVREVVVKIVHWQDLCYDGWDLSYQWVRSWLTKSFPKPDQTIEKAEVTKFWFFQRTPWNPFFWEVHFHLVWILILDVAGAELAQEGKVYPVCQNLLTMHIPKSENKGFDWSALYWSHEIVCFCVVAPCIGSETMKQWKNSKVLVIWGM